jgi:trk/ktr system potassium uptake protein
VHVVIMGCGRVGSSLAGNLDSMGHSVTVVDQEASSFRRLPPEFRGRTITGVGFDREILAEAGIHEAAAFAAVSSGDNSNILAARVARETFGIESVVARIYDPKRAEVYQRLGIPTVATVTWTADQMLRRLLPSGAAVEWVDPSGAIRLAEVHFDPAWVGRHFADLEQHAPCRVGLVTRLGTGMLPRPDLVVQEGDLVHVLLREHDVEVVEAVLGAPPPQGES